jgi:flagellar P-ring protein precursor FlgI
MRTRSIALILTVILVSLLVEIAQAARIKDIAGLRGVRNNQLVGYGVVVGLKGTGDGDLEYTNQSVMRMLDKLGVKLEGGAAATGNVAAVLVTATLPPFARAGNPLDVAVHSLGNASSLEGGTLIQTPLRAANQQIYAVAQGAVLTGQSGTAGRIPAGATIERDLEANLGDRAMFRLTLHQPDFTTAARAATTINMDLGGHYAKAIDPSTVDIIVPPHYQGKTVELIAAIEGLEVERDQKARVVVNPKTGTVVIGQDVRIHQVALSHGNLSIQVGGASPENTAGRGLASTASKGAPGQRVAIVGPTAQVGELVNALNDLGVGPQDLITILQNLKSAGALEGELEVL